MQLALQLSHPEEHFSQLHQEAIGSVILWNKLGREGKRWLKIRPEDDPSAVLIEQQGKQDRFISVSQFYHWRLISNLKALQAVYVDVDGTEDIPSVLEALRDHKMPAPSFIVMSGRGLHCYWLHGPKPHQALPVWQLMQEALVKVLAPLGADPLAKDCARVLRIVGSVNSKNKKIVRGVEISGTRWEFHLLANEILGYRPAPPKARVSSITAARAERGEPAPVYTRKSIKSREYLVFRDILTLCNRLYKKGVGADSQRRDLIIFHLARALSWYAEPGTLEDEIVKLARRWTPSLSEKEVLTYTKPVRERALAAAKGEKIIWCGQERDPRYWYKRQTLFDAFEDMIIEADCADELRAIISDDTRRERDKAGAEARRRAKGAVARADYESSAEARQKAALALKEAGLSYKLVAEKMNITVGAAKGLISRARKGGSGASPYSAPTSANGTLFTAEQLNNDRGVRVHRRI